MQNESFSSAMRCGPDSRLRKFSTSRKLTGGFWFRSKRLWILRKNWRGRRIETRWSHFATISEPMSENASLILMERIERAILLIRHEKVMLDSDLAAIYG